MFAVATRKQRIDCWLYLTWRRHLGEALEAFATKRQDRKSTFQFLKHAMVIASLITVFGDAAASAASLTGKPRIIDGDTIHIGKTKIRLHGIDAPEMRQTCITDSKRWSCGKAATAALKHMIGDGDVICIRHEQDRYGRIVAVCRASEVNLNARMVLEGWALAYRRYSMDYVGDESIARDTGLGMWRGKFIPPWDWRRGKRLVRKDAPNCPVKGNVNGRKQRIYHVPGGRYFDQVRIRPEQGDKCFLIEAEAEAAGFRKSRQ
jgi:endonuclease YncB( thermonuclease family)